jgi:hypothetical protein
MTAIVFNSVPMEDVEQDWGSDAARERTRGLIREMMRYHQEPIFRTFFRGKFRRIFCPKNVG